MKQTLRNFVFTFLLLVGIVACGGDSADQNMNDGGGAQAPSAEISTNVPPTESAETNSSEPTTDATTQTTTVTGKGLSVTDIAPIPDDFPSNIRTNFSRYTQVIAPNGKAITLQAQDQLTDAQIIQARNTLVFWLTDVPGSQYGADKSAVANQMADNGATLNLLNGVDDGANPAANTAGQALFFGELVAPGSDWYINNDFEHRDATFEEILHLVHDTGIGVDGPNTQPGALPDYQADIRAATTNALPENNGLWADNPQLAEWLEEIRQENSLTQEYLASVIDSYYGLWGPFTERPGGMWGGYVAKTRADIAELDPMGYALMGQFFSPYLTYNALLDPAFDGTFTMTFDESTPYTHKSQYLLHATLSGTNNANLTGNDQDNTLSGNSGDNVLDGLDGNDTALYPRAASEYTVTQNDDGTTTVVGDGTDTLVNIEQIEFSDGAASGADSAAQAVASSDSAESSQAKAFGDASGTHIGQGILRQPVRDAAADIYTDSGIVTTDEYGTYTKMMTVYGITFIAQETMPDDFMLQVAQTTKEMFAQTDATNPALQEAVLQNLYRYNAVLPVVSGEPDGLEQFLEKSSIVDIIMNDSQYQVMEVVEHILHTVTDIGMHYAQNDQFGLHTDSALYLAMDEAIADGFYQAGGYNDIPAGEIRDRILMQEYTYWVITSAWDLQETHGLGENEWTLVTPAQLEASQPAAFELYQDHVTQVLTAPQASTLEWFNQ